MGDDTPTKADVFFIDSAFETALDNAVYNQTVEM